jgi:hypothetical protein
MNSCTFLCCLNLIYGASSWTDCTNTMTVIQYCHTEAGGEEAL